VQVLSKESPVSRYYQVWPDSSSVSLDFIPLSHALYKHLLSPSFSVLYSEMAGGSMVHVNDAFFVRGENFFFSNFWSSLSDPNAPLP
jgi:hypothetical protein